MLSTPSEDAPPRERLPSFLLSGAPTATGGSPAPAPSPPPHALPSSPGNAPLPFAPRRAGASVTFNDRLRGDRGPSATPPSTSGYALTTPTRLPPTKSLLDGGPPSVLALQTPPPSTGSFARPTSTPYTMHAGATPGGPIYSMPGTPVAGSVTPGLERWVTVFGFPAHLEAAAVRELRRHGDIVRTIPGRGNWVHLLFRTALQANVALHRPWRVLPGAEVMIGAVACTEPDVARDMDIKVNEGISAASPAGARMADVTMTSVVADDDAAAVSHGMRTGMQTMGAGTPARGTPLALRTPATVLRRDGGTTPTATAATIVRTPQRQTGFLDYLTGFYK